MDVVFFLFCFVLLFALLFVTFLLFFFPFIFISWRLIILKYCSGFCHTLTWISHGFTCVPHPEPPSYLPPHPLPLGHPSALSLSKMVMITLHARCYFCFGSIPSFFLELFLHWSPVAYWAPTDLGSSSFSVLSFCFFILFMGFSRQAYWSGLPFPSPVDHILSDLSTMTCLSWVAPHSIA